MNKRRAEYYETNPKVGRSPWTVADALVRLKNSELPNEPKRSIIFNQRIHSCSFVFIRGQEWVQRFAKLQNEPNPKNGHPRTKPA
jgi:hypothetical protein